MLTFKVLFKQTKSHNHQERAMKFKSHNEIEETPESVDQNIPEGNDTSQLMELFEDQLKDLFWAEKELINVLPSIISAAESDELILSLTEQMKQTHAQVTRLAGVFNSVDMKPSTVKCETMEGLIKETNKMMKNCEKGPKCDAGIITAVQKIKHYEIASYGTLRKFSETLGLKDAEKLLNETLKEEKAIDQKLTEIAVKGVNKEAAIVQR